MTLSTADSAACPGAIWGTCESVNPNGYAVALSSGTEADHLDVGFDVKDGCSASMRVVLFGDGYGQEVLNSDQPRELREHNLYRKEIVFMVAAQSRSLYAAFGNLLFHFEKPNLVGYFGDIPRQLVDALRRGSYAALVLVEGEKGAPVTIHFPLKGSFRALTEAERICRGALTKR
jgi:hypothetical protein